MRFVSLMVLTAHAPAAQSCYGGDGGAEYTAEGAWLDSAEDGAALRSLLRAAEEDATAPVEPAAGAGAPS